LRLRLHHHSDGARVAYREEGAGQPLVLLHSLGLSHREWAPIVPLLSDRYRVILPDLPLHGDSEDSPEFPYSPDWITTVMANFCSSVGGPRVVIGGHGLGGDVALRAVAGQQVHPWKLILCSTRLHGRPHSSGLLGVWRAASLAGAIPVLNRIVGRGAKVGSVPVLARRLTATGNKDVEDLVRHAFSDVGDKARSRAWARFARHWPTGPDRSVMNLYGRIECPVLLLWADSDPLHSLDVAKQAVDLLPDAQLRVLERTGFLPAYDDAEGLAREIAAFVR
jgi:pimeloyl-ACP methyl ester carboxylesterase